MDMPEVEQRIRDIEKRFDTLPDIIAAKISETMELKIKTATQELELRFFKWIVPLCIGTIGSLIGLLINFLQK